jgi:hypothetical protein
MLPATVQSKTSTREMRAGSLTCVRSPGVGWG